MKFFKPFATVILFISSTIAEAGQKYVDSTADCAAQMFIMTSAGNTMEGLDKYFAQQGRIAGMMLGLYMEGSSSKRVTNGMVMQATEKKLSSIESTAMTTMTVTSVSNCIGWNFALAKILEKNQGTSQELIKRSLLRGPKPTQKYKYPFPDAPQLPDWISIAKENWRKSGYMTPGKIREKLKK